MTMVVLASPSIGDFGDVILGGMTTTSMFKICAAVVVVERLTVSTTSGLGTSSSKKLKNTFLVQVPTTKDQ